MTHHVGIDCCPYTREKKSEDNGEEAKKDIFRSMLGCAVVTDNYEELKKSYFEAVENSLKDCGLNIQRNILCSSELLSIKKGSFDIHEEIFKSIIPHISGLNIFFTRFNSKKIPKIKVYGKKLPSPKEITINEFYDSHLTNSFPHICAWKIFNYIYGTKAHVHLDYFQSEITDAWDEISSYPNLNCYINGDMCNILISLADIICKIVDNRLANKNLFLNCENIHEIFPEIEESKLYVHKIDIRHLRSISMIHTNNVNLYGYMKRPIFYLYLEKGNKIDRKIVLSAIPKCINYVNTKGGCFKFFTHDDIVKMKENDYLVCLDSKFNNETEMIKKLLSDQMGINITAIDIKSIN